jgi:hypothetical protein
VFAAPLAVTAHATFFTILSSDDRPVLEEGALAVADEPVRIVSLRGVDATHLAVTDVDLTECAFAGAFHLDQLRLHGRITFGRPPAGWFRHGLLPQPLDPAPGPG